MALSWCNSPEEDHTCSSASKSSRTRTDPSSSGTQLELPPAEEHTSATVVCETMPALCLHPHVHPAGSVPVLRTHHPRVLQERYRSRRDHGLPARCYNTAPPLLVAEAKLIPEPLDAQLHRPSAVHSRRYRNIAAEPPRLGVI